MRKLYNYIFTVKTAERSKFEIILWWELRRIFYNFVVLVTGIISLSVILYADVFHVDGDEGLEPLGIFVFAFLCNVCYTLGWFTEIFIPKCTTYGPKMLKIGTGFTLAVVLFPALIHIGIWIFNKN